MGVYRVEASPNNRAGCQVKECKDAGSKITKGQFRFAVQVTIHEHVSWQYRHWGCVTPKQIENLIEVSGGDTDMVDGYDELPAEFQEKVKFALENGHIPDEDCTHADDVEYNRPGAKKPRAKKAKKTDEEDGNDADEKPKKKPAAKAKKNAVKDEDEEDAPAPALKKRGPKAKKVKNEEEEDVPAPAPKKRGRPAKKEVADEEDGVEEEAAPPAKKARASGRTKNAPKYNDSEEEAPAPKKVEPEANSDVDEEAPEPKKVPQKRGRKKAVATDE
ncbi:hypothetical protein BKA58DRAFT_53096 [Alternaria rosae]|uniref:uncharacterized protein n=1 Tax=Alternaria rosae TaxID=1187941 RepID=UPI001E8E170F|nr:uncharacterized protein BKA58DRAFT_53096 [Alternaria rosae]KAH6859071.1 hypothetical protein BKA58DRAFT_53096 [Alternaria rosae]